MSPIERAARALCELDGQPPMVTMDGKPLWQDYLPEVRAVLTAIREPSEEMLLALRAQIQNVSDREDEVWNFVFDVLLAEGE